MRAAVLAILLSAQCCATAIEDELRKAEADPIWLARFIKSPSGLDQGEFALHQNPLRLCALTPKGGQAKRFLL